MLASSSIISAGDRVRAAPESSTSESRWRHQKIAISVVASIIGILALIVVVLYLSKPLGPVGSGGQPAGTISPCGRRAQECASIGAGASDQARSQGHAIAGCAYWRRLRSSDSPTHGAVSVPQDGGWVTT